MKKIIIARHGHYSGRDLDQCGRGEMKAMGEALASLLGAHSIRVVSSTAPRALQSAEILSDRLSVPVEEHRFLWTGPDSPRGCLADLNAALQLVKTAGEDSMIIVTHLEFTDTLPWFLGKHLLGNDHFPRGNINKGQACVIDCETKTWTMLRPQPSAT
jgi:phosphohistidine phosphatase SixA